MNSEELNSLNSARFRPVLLEPAVRGLLRLMRFISLPLIIKKGREVQEESPRDYYDGLSSHFQKNNSWFSNSPNKGIQIRK